ncbi:hypothetical protein [Plesiomonas shigelloides]|uniref:hypothetical protein n=1 Tax=Plesiomonas shigelloides TaxID=703 RepID=UPI0012E00B2C|nr:hypothetical protein [Plesiomonas shigelloides]
MRDDIHNIFCLLNKLNTIVDYLCRIDGKYISPSALSELNVRNERLIDSISSLTNISITAAEKSRALSLTVDIRVKIAALSQNMSA